MPHNSRVSRPGSIHPKENRPQKKPNYAAVARRAAQPRNLSSMGSVKGSDGCCDSQNGSPEAKQPSLTTDAPQDLDREDPSCEGDHDIGTSSVEVGELQPQPEGLSDEETKPNVERHRHSTSPIFSTPESIEPAQPENTPYPPHDVKVHRGLNKSGFQFKAPFTPWRGGAGVGSDQHPPARRMPWNHHPGETQAMNDGTNPEETACVIWTEYFGPPGVLSFEEAFELFALGGFPGQEAYFHQALISIEHLSQSGDERAKFLMAVCLCGAVGVQTFWDGCKNMLDQVSIEVKNSQVQMWQSHLKHSYASSVPNIPVFLGNVIHSANPPFAHIPVQAAPRSSHHPHVGQPMDDSHLRAMQVGRIDRILPDSPFTSHSLSQEQQVHPGFQFIGSQTQNHLHEPSRKGYESNSSSSQEDSEDSLTDCSDSVSEASGEITATPAAMPPRPPPLLPYTHVRYGQAAFPPQGIVNNGNIVAHPPLPVGSVYSGMVPPGPGYPIAFPGQVAGNQFLQFQQFRLSNFPYPSPSVQTVLALWVGALAPNRNQDRRVYLLSQAAKQNFAPALYLLACALVRGTSPKLKKNPVLAKHYFEQAAAHGHVDAMYELAKLHQFGAGDVAMDKAVALSWYQKSAGYGHCGSLQTLAFRLFTGTDGLARDIPRAIRNLRACIDERGSHTAMKILAKIYVRLAQDKKLQAASEEVHRQLSGSTDWEGMAADLWLQLAQSGDPEGQFQTAWNHRRGMGVEKNTESSIFWFRQAAGNGHRGAMRFLARKDDHSAFVRPPHRDRHPRHRPRFRGPHHSRHYSGHRTSRVYGSAFPPFEAGPAALSPPQQPPQRIAQHPRSPEFPKLACQGNFDAEVAANKHSPLSGKCAQRQEAVEGSEAKVDKENIQPNTSHLSQG